MNTPIILRQTALVHYGKQETASSTPSACNGTNMPNS
jgi:hypothetical protein